MEGIASLKVIDCRTWQESKLVAGQPGTDWRDWLVSQHYISYGKTELPYLRETLVFESFRRINEDCRCWYALYRPGIGSNAEDILMVHIPNQVVLGQLLVAAKTVAMTAIEQLVNKRTFEAKNYKGVERE